MGGRGAAWAAYCPRASVPAPVSLARSASRRAPLAGRLPLPRTPSEPMLKKENILHGAISGAFHIASKPNLHFSPRGEAKCVRGPSGRGASRAEEKGARRRTYQIASFIPRSRNTAFPVHWPSGRGASRSARAGVLEPYIEHGKQAQRSHGGHTACFDRRVVRHAGLAPHMVFTNHETRNTNHGLFFACFDRRVVRHAGLAPSHGFHESRDTKHESRPFFACFDRRVVRNAG